MPASGCHPPPLTDAASSVPTSGPTHANEVSENVNPISSAPAMPPRPEARSMRVNSEEGRVISKAPNRLSPKARNTSAMKPFTQGLDPSCTTPNGPSSAVAANPSDENSTTMPSENTAACTMLAFRDPVCRLRKNDMVIGIIGNTHGVKIAASPKPKATSRNMANERESLPAAVLTVSAAAVGCAAGPPRLNSANSAGIATFVGRAPGSISRLAVAVRFTGGRHILSLQVW